MLGLSQRTIQKKAPEYSLTVNANVSNYQVFIDGRRVKVKGRTVTRERGTYTVKVVAQGYYD